MPGSIRVLLAEDVAIVRKGLKLFLSKSPEITVCAEAGDGLEAVELARTAALDAVLMDLSMPGLDGLEAIAVMKRERPGLPVIALTAHMEPELVASAIRAGASGYLQKSAGGAELARALKTAVSGGSAFCRAVFGMIREGRDDVVLPLPEGPILDVLEELAAGTGVDQAAINLGITPEEVRSRLDMAGKQAGTDTIPGILLYCMSALSAADGPSSPDSAQ